MRPSGHWRPRDRRSPHGGRVTTVVRALALVLVALGVTACSGGSPAPTTTTAVTTTTTPAPTTTTDIHGPTASGSTSGLVSGRTTAIGDSLMLDYGSTLQSDLPGVVIDAVVGRQWITGVQEVQQLRAEHQLGATVVIDLGTNGPVTPSLFNQMVTALEGVPRVVYVTVHVDQPWQDETNATLRELVPRTPGAVLCDWATLAATNPSWFYSDGTHLPIGGPGAHALARLVANAVTAG
jgi:hypothetical protein